MGEWLMTYAPCPDTVLLLPIRQIPEIQAEQYFSPHKITCAVKSSLKSFL